MAIMEVGTQKEKAMSGDILDAIKREKAKMRSRWFFVARSALFALAAFILFVALLYLISFIIFALQRSGVWLAPDFGPAGWLLFLGGLPWGLLLVALIIVLVLAALLSRYEFVYHHPLFYGLFAFVFVAVAVSFLIAATSFHERVFEYSAENLPLLGQFYAFETEAPPTIHRGEIVALAPGVWVIADASGITSTVVAEQKAVLAGDFHIGDNVIVFGDREPDGSIDAFGVEKAP